MTEHLVIALLNMSFTASVMILFLMVNAVLYAKLRFRLRTAVKLGPGVFESEHISMPMVLGILRPDIFLPCRLEEEERTYILAHERTHIKRRDYLAKLLGFLALAVHWFNPFVWLSFIKMCRDMEMSCDERVVREMGAECKTDYANTLLQFSVRKSGLLVPPAFWVSLLAVIGLMGTAVVFLTSPPPNRESFSIGIIGGADGPTSIFVAGKKHGGVEKTNIQSVIPEELSEVTLPSPDGTDEQGSRGIKLDYASGDRVVFHGSFGICVFDKQEDLWKMTHSIDMGKTDKRYSDPLYVSEVVYTSGQLLVGFKEGDDYQDDVYFYNIAGKTLENINGITAVLKTAKESVTAKLPAGGHTLPAGAAG